MAHPKEGQRLHDINSGERQRSPVKKKKEKTQLAFGKIPAYCKYELFMERYRSASDFIRLAHAGKDSLKLLDVGSGNGYLKYFCDFGQIDWHGIEIWEERFRDCQKLGYHMHWCDIDTETLPFPGESFDVVVASHVLEHLQNREFALKEMYRVLKTGGWFIVGAPIKPVLVSNLLNFLYSRRRLQKGETAYNFDLPSLMRFLRRNLPGAQILDVRGFRVLSARKTRNWENHWQFYRVNTCLGRKFPGLTPEVNVVLRKCRPSEALEALSFGFSAGVSENTS